MGVFDEFRNKKSEELLERLSQAAEKLGLYMKAAQMVTPPDCADEEDPPVFIQALFAVGERALSEEVSLEDTELEAQFRDLVGRISDPTEEIRAELAKGMRQGKGILDLDEDTTDILDQ